MAKNQSPKLLDIVSCACRTRHFLTRYSPLTDANYSNVQDEDTITRQGETVTHEIPKVGDLSYSLLRRIGLRLTHGWEARFEANAAYGSAAA